MKKTTDLPALKVEQFGQFFQDLHGYEPFPWQRMLLSYCDKEGRWPDVIDLPTASGKTACIDIAIFLLALQAELSPDTRTAPRRIWFVVNRRIVVDEAYERARRIAGKLHDHPKGVVRDVAERLKHVGGTGLPLAVGRLRGGTPKQLAWSYHPAQPAVITSTVDQIGSRLLFRGYGVGENSRPIHAALAGNDGLILLDEAHTANAFRQTLKRVSKLRQSERDCAKCVKSPFAAVTMSATPPQADGEQLTVFPKASERKAALANDELQARFKAEKPAQLIEVANATATTDPLAQKAAEVAADLAVAHRRVAVMVNRVATAGAVARIIKAAHPEKFDVALLTGRMRPLDRDDLIRRYSPSLRAKDPVVPPDKKPIILITTQCLEVGADFSFDALVTECASLDALRQRFGRLNRLGTLSGPAQAFILIRAGEVKEDGKLDKAKPLDPVYGNAMARTWNWLHEHADTPARGAGAKRTPAVIGMGIHALEAKLAGPDLTLLRAPAPDAPVLLPVHLDLLSQTSPAPAMELDISLFLHGTERGAPEAFVVFRQDIPFESEELATEMLELMPPLTGERLAVPLWRLKQWLAGEGNVDSSDVESEAVNDNRTAPMNSARRFARFRGKSDINPRSPLDDLRAGDTVLLRVDEWPDELGTRWPGNPIDIYERAYETAHARKIVRLRMDAPGDGITEQQRAMLALIEEDEAPSLTELRAISADVLERAMYPDGSGLIVVFKFAGDAEEELDPYAFDEEALLEGEGIEGVKEDKALLATHTHDVVERSCKFAERIFDATIIASIETAARLHDSGKRDPRFQDCLNNGRRFSANDCLAKSRTFIPQMRWKALRSLAGLPDGFRHEMLSMQFADKQLFEDTHRALVLHLIASHHGLSRPLVPIVVDDPSCDAAFEDEMGKYIAIAASERVAMPLHRLDSGLAERFWNLTRIHGWWGLALLEAVLRLADWRASKEGDKGNR